MIVTEGGRFGGYGLFLSKGDRGHSAGARWCSSTTCSTSSARRGKGRNSSRANTPSCSTSSTTAPASARAARASCPWTASPWPRRPWNTRPRSCSRRTKTFDVGQDTRTGVAMIEYRYDCPFKFTGKIDKLTVRPRPGAVHRAGSQATSGHCRPGRPREGLGEFQRNEEVAYSRRGRGSGHGCGAGGGSIARRVAVARRGTYRRRHTGSARAGIALIALGVACWPGSAALSAC